MPYQAFTAGETDPDKPGLGSWGEQVMDNLDYFNGLLGGFDGQDVYNGSFEIDADADNIPDGWTVSLHPGGSATVDATGEHGKNQFKFTAPSGATNGGGTLISDYIPIGRADRFESIWLALQLWATNTGIGATVKVLAYNAAKALQATTTVFSSTTLPTSADRILMFRLSSTALPSTVRYMRVQLEGGTVGPGIAGSVYFDAVTIRPRVPFNWDESATFTEQTTTSATFVQVATFTIHAPFLIYNDEMITFPIELKGSSAADIWVRAKIGSNYSAEYKIVSDTVNYETVNVQMPNTLAGNLTTTVAIELKVEAGTGYAKKSRAWLQHSLLDYHRP